MLRALTLAALVLVLAAPAVSSAQPATSTPALDAFASQLVGAPFTVECFAPIRDEQAGTAMTGYVILAGGIRADGSTYVTRAEPVIHLSYQDCRSLNLALAPGAAANLRRDPDAMELLGYALQDLNHEATHELLLSLDEALVECTAYRNLWPLTARLGLGWKQREQLYRAGERAHRTTAGGRQNDC